MVKLVASYIPYSLFVLTWCCNLSRFVIAMPLGVQMSTDPERFRVKVDQRTCTYTERSPKLSLAQGSCSQGVKASMCQWVSNLLTNPWPREVKELLCSPPCLPMLLALSSHHLPPLITSTNPSPHLPQPLLVSVRGWGTLCLCSKGFLPGNFLCWKLWGNFLSGRPLPGADNENHLKPSDISLNQGWSGPSLLFQSLGGWESASVQKPQASHLGGTFQKLNTAAVICKFSISPHGYTGGIGF